MVLQENSIGQTFSLLKNIRTMIPDDHVCFFIEKLVNCVAFNEIDFKYVDTPGQKAFPAAMLVHIIIWDTIYSIHSSRKLNVLFVRILCLCIWPDFKPLFSAL